MINLFCVSCLFFFLFLLSVNVDISVYYRGFHADLNETFCVGSVDDESRKLIKVTYEALEKAIAEVRPGTMFREFGNIINKHVTVAG